MQLTETRNRIFLSPPHMSGNEQKYIKEAFDTNWIAPLGQNVDIFENSLAQYLNVKDAVAVSSGTAAIHLALCLLNIKKGDKVFCSSLTFIASANPIIYQGGEPVFIDSEPETWNMSPFALEQAFKDAVDDGELPKAVIVVNLYGQPAKMDEITSICNYYKVPIIEDAAESLGSIYKGRASGTFGEFGIYSFNGNKIITTSGGGMLVSNDTELLKRARFLATQARDSALHYQHSHIGFNYRMSNILAGIGRGQLEVLEERVEAKRSIFQKYYQELHRLPGINFMPELEYTKSNRWLTTLTIDNEKAGVTVEELIYILMEDNIEARPVWKPLHLQPIFSGAKYYSHSENHSVSELLFKSGVCLPSGTGMTEKEQMRVINCIKGIINSRVTERAGN